jgi:hypothetical protein
VRHVESGVDSSAWPLVVMRIPERFHIEAIDRIAHEWDAVLSRKEKFAAIIDTAPLTSFPNATERQRIVELWRARTFAEAAYSVGYAIVIVSAPARAVLTALMWLRPAAVAQQIVGDFDDAVEWSCGRLAGAGIELNPQIEAIIAARRSPARAHR